MHAPDGVTLTIQDHEFVAIIGASGSGSSATYAFPKLAAIAVCFLALRAFLYFERVRIYFVEK